MYLAHWGLREAPFRSALDPRHFFQSPTHEEALARVNFLIDGGRRAGLLLGGAGSGKSLLLEVLAAQARQLGCEVAKFSLLGLDKHEFQASLAACWGVDVHGDSVAYAWRVLLDHLTAQRIEGRESIVLLDDCDEATADLLNQVLRLTLWDVASRPATTLILAARSGRVARLGDRLLELADLRIDLTPWNVDDTRNYLEQALARAGRTEPTFPPEAISLLAELSQGVPRNIVQWADLALVAAAGRELAEVDAATVESVYAELGVVQQLVDAQQLVDVR